MTDKITTAELATIFGPEMPMEAFQLLANPGLRTPDEMRAVLRSIANEHTPRTRAKQALAGKIWSWVEQHDLRHSEAVEIATEVFDEFKAK